MMALKNEEEIDRHGAGNSREPDFESRGKDGSDQIAEELERVFGPGVDRGAVQNQDPYGRGEDDV